MGSAWVEKLAEQWWLEISHIGYVPASAERVCAILAQSISDLVEALSTEPFDPSAGQRLGETLVALNLTDPAVLTHSSRTLACLPTLMPSPPPDAQLRMTGLTAAIGHGYAAAVTARTLAEQDALSQAMTAAHVSAERARRAADTRFRAVFDSTAAAILILDLGGAIVEANAAVAAMLGRTRQSLRAVPIMEFLHPEERREIRDLIIQLIEIGTGTSRFEKRLRRADGSFGWASWTVTLVPATGTDPGYLLAVGDEVTDRRAWQARLQHQARHDSLTGLLNRTALLERLSSGLMEPENRVGAVVFVDLNGFKRVNDRFGHGVGDTVLRVVACRMRAAMRDIDVVGRFGGDEFVILVGDPVPPGGTGPLLVRLGAAIAEPVGIGPDGRWVRVTASVGATRVARTERRSIERLLHDADSAMYRMKEAITGGAPVAGR
ncbi:diguanylate cyclase [Nocardia terpenica]|uniref:Diguanylate cyclase n=1 Tax=Nocardia terpenica TaxID=455432 RepID=A0A291RL51_9NOCA|nr:diguanylate cyclase [Nocardia terpenica]ATL68107.1 hypothetical protein CRH09_19880 [Nocardia terpenica]